MRVQCHPERGQRKATHSQRLQTDELVIQEAKNMFYIGNLVPLFMLHKELLSPWRRRHGRNRGMRESG